jgi:hypothetical protein
MRVTRGLLLTLCGRRSLICNTSNSERGSNGKKGIKEGKPESNDVASEDPERHSYIIITFDWYVSPYENNFNCSALFPCCNCHHGHTNIFIHPQRERLRERYT